MDLQEELNEETLEKSKSLFCLAESSEKREFAFALCWNLEWVVSHFKDSLIIVSQHAGNQGLKYQ